MLDAARELARFDPTLPVEDASTPPASWYTLPDVWERERKDVFGRHFLGVGPLARLDAPGAYTTGALAGEPYVVTRNDRGALSAFFNVCRHHATRLVEGDGRCAQLVCPYHGWTYALDGRLVKAPGMGHVRGFDRDASGLVPLAVAPFGPLVFVGMEAGATFPAEPLRPLGEALDAMGWCNLSFAVRRRYELACNWKVFVDNYLDGGYHVPHLHGALAGQLDLDSYAIELGDAWSIQRAGAAAKNDDGLDFAARLEGGALYAFVYPNLMINRYGPMMDVNYVLPLGPRRTEVVFDYFFAPELDEDFRARALEASDRVQREDIAVSEAVQIGLESRAYDRGRYAAREVAMLHFHRLLAKDLAPPGG